MHNSRGCFQLLLCGWCQVLVWQSAVALFTDMLLMPLLLLLLPWVLFLPHQLLIMLLLLRLLVSLLLLHLLPLRLRPAAHLSFATSPMSIQ